MISYRCALALDFKPHCWLRSTPLHIGYIYSDPFPGWQLADKIMKPQVSINSNNALTDCKKPKPKMEICNQK